MTRRRLERALEVVLAAGVVTSGLLLFGGLALDRAGLLRAGILLLMLTPVARVLVVTAGLLHGRDWLFGAVSLAILVVLGTSLWVAVREAEHAPDPPSRTWPAPLPGG